MSQSLGDLGCYKALVLGVNTRAVANSLKSLGFYVYSVSYYAPEDLKADEKFFFVNPYKHGKLKDNYDPKKLLEKAKEIADSVDYIFITSGVFEYIKKAPKWENVVGNEPKKIVKLSNKYKVYKKLENLGYNIPTYKIIYNRHQLEKFREEFKKIVLKPISGCGGLAKNLEFPILAQEFIKSESFSINFIDNTFITFNKQIIINGQYAGNITPYKLSKTYVNELRDIIEVFELEGMNGLDFLINNNLLYIIDLNPRILGTFDTIEISSRKNLVKALLNKEYAKTVKPNRVYEKRIIFANRRLKVRIKNYRCLYDIPKNGAIIEKDEPIFTVISDSNIKNIIRESVKYEDT
ncbi:hypothetical protein J422_06306 [Methanocaldococcus villosus KIN24-T80]|uniref:ATP-grasp fold PylC-type domain-containing protein n=1 Tax=Methanocaldococcus villosus KIN24-T80 TaxID=1069083 RepID=N6UTQ3_9EURY|nr:ATP-grasp domain-containing protein [Methanocaldococcus villosus]ENN95719.1 hypothetical protein J422_06306 [Methanocaldococcus villosus KIN24-T80]